MNTENLFYTIIGLFLILFLTANVQSAEIDGQKPTGSHGKYLPVIESTGSQVHGNQVHGTQLHGNLVYESRIHENQLHENQIHENRSYGSPDETEPGNDNQDELFRNGMDFYSEAKYDSAVQYFTKLETPEARLFAGKSYLALSQYALAKKYLGEISRDDDPRFFDEARYTLALTCFQTGQFGRSLDLLHQLKSRRAYQDLHRDAEVLYQQIMGYLTTEQRKPAFLQSNQPRVQFDLFRYGLDYMLQKEAEELFRALEPYFHTTLDTNIIGAVKRRIDRMPVEHAATAPFGKAPAGIVYDIGILLPDTESGSREWNVARSLYNGYLLAAEEFNRNNDDKKIRLHHYEISDTSLTHESAMAKLAWQHHVDAVIGPLFSESAYRIRDIAENYHIPVIPPLANSDTLNIANPYMYQINPTFETRGKAMAEFAVNELEMDTLAVITQSNQPVAREARAFRNRAEQLGATVLHYFSENFEERAFEVGHITPWFAGNERYIDDEDITLKHVDGLYISVTGHGAEQLIDLILNDLQAFRSEVTILSNEEMAHVDLSEARRTYFDIYFSNFFYKDDDRRETYNFQNNFRSLTGHNADNFAHLGYDVATFLFESIDVLQNPARIKMHLRHRPALEGVITNIDFQGSHINQHLHMLHIERDKNVRYRPPEDDDEDENTGEIE